MGDTSGSYPGPPSIVPNSQGFASSLQHQTSGGDESIAGTYSSSRSHENFASRPHQHQHHHPDDDRRFFFSQSQMGQSYDERSYRDDLGSERAFISGSRSVRSISSLRSARSRTSNTHSSGMRNRAGIASRRESGEMDTPGMSVMSVVIEGSEVSFCCYKEDRNEIVQDSCRANGYETQSLVEHFIQIVQPTLVLVSTRIVNNDSLLQMVTAAPSLVQPKETQRNDGQTSISCKDSPNNDASSFSKSSIPYQVLKSTSFDFQRCKATILQKLQVESLSKERNGANTADRGYLEPDTSRQFLSNSTEFGPSSYHYLAAVINLDSKTLVKALGSLLSYLEVSVFQLDGGRICINRIVEAKISEHMMISPTTFAALHIFAEETHPLIGKKHGNSKEGFSLYSLLDRTCSKGGRKLFKEWMMKPLNDLESINSRLDCIDLFLKPAFQITVGAISTLLKRVASVDGILIRIQKCTANPKDFLMLKASLYAMISLGNILRNEVLAVICATPGVATKRCYDVFSDLLKKINPPTLMGLRERITDVLDEEETLARDPMTEGIAIRHGYSQELDSAREQYEDLDRVLDEVGNYLLQIYPQLIGLDVTFLSQLGFLVSLRKELVHHAQIELPEDFEHIFDEELVYFKCTETKKLDADCGDLYAAMHDTELLIMHQLEDDIREAEDELLESFKAVSTLDCLLSLTECAADLGLTRPQMIDIEEDQVVYAKEARHPLLEVISAREFVPNDIRIDKEDRVVVVTGPNYSGKSCYLRQIGLLVYMCHIGSFVPATQARVSITDQIFARFSSVESWSRPQSGYQQECTEIASVFHKATSKSLVLLDEVGKGTHPASGLAILGASLKKLGRMHCNTACTTHFLELFSMNILKDQELGIRARRMTVSLPKEKSDDSLIPLFKLENGVATSSAGLVCAKHAGIPEEVIKRASQIIEATKKNESVKPLSKLTGEPTFSTDEAQLLLHFSSVEDWEEATDDDLRLLIQNLSKLEQ